MDKDSKIENPRWILLAGIFFTSLFVLWLFKLAIAALLGKLGYESISTDEVVGKANADACTLLSLGSELVLTDPVLKLKSGIPEIDMISTVSRIAAGLASTSCKLHESLYQFRASATDDNVVLTREAGIELNKSIEEFLFESRRASEILKTLPETVSPLPVLEESMSVIEKALDLVIQNEDNLRITMRLGSHFNSLSHNEYWLVGLQNLAEARATGGILGNYALVQVGPSGFNLIESGSNLDLFAKGKSLVVDGYQSSYHVLGADSSDWRDINAIPEEKVALQSILASWENSSEIKIDGIILLGQGLAAQAIALSGPLVLEGITLKGSNARDFLAGGIYEKFPDQAQRNKVLSHFLELAFDALSTQNLDLTAVLDNSESIQSGDRLLAMAKDEDLDGFLNKPNEKDDPSDAIHIALNNAGANKLDRYTHIETTTCKASGQAHAGTSVQGHVIRIRNMSPKFGLPEHVSPKYFRASGVVIPMGTNRLQLLVGIPNGLSLIDFETSTAQEVFSVLELGNKTFYVFEFEIAPGGAETFRFVHTKLHETNASFFFSPLLNKPESNQQLCKVIIGD